MTILFSKTLRLCGVLALGLLLAGCDKCGNFYTLLGGGTPQACRSDAPQPR